jgi:Tol biopolymer transport system component
MMNWRFRTNMLSPGIKAGTLGVACLLAVGCTQYNGALGFGSKKDRIRAQALQTHSTQALEPRATTAYLDNSSQADDNAASSQNPETRQAELHSPETQAAAYSAGQTEASAQALAATELTDVARPMTDPRIQNLTLYGRLPHRDNPNPEAGKSSPMDSPDNIRRVTFASQGADFDPQMDPTGKYIVYASTQHRKNADIYVKTVNGTAITQLTSDPAQDMMPTFSPDGTKIAFCSDRAGNWDIYIMDLSGGQPVQITSDPADDFHPSFSPDGRRLVYCTFGNQSGQWELVVINLDNPGPKRFIGHGLFPCWSPKGDRILFQRARERGTRWFSLWTLDFVNGEGVRPTEILASSNAAAITPRWSPDGSHIVFCTVVDPDASLDKGPTQADIWVVAADGSGRTNLTKSPFVNLQPVWGKDGTIYFASNRGVGGVQNIWSIRPDRALQIARETATGHNDDEPAMATHVSVPPLLAPQDRASASVNPRASDPTAP